MFICSKLKKLIIHGRILILDKINKKAKRVIILFIQQVMCGSCELYITHDTTQY